MAKRARWDHVGLDVLRAYKPHPDATTPVGWRVRNGTTWYSLGEIVGDDVIAVSDEGAPVVLPLDETFREWDPELDPLVFEELKKEAVR